ncbi:DUF3626 domain-containing protein [Paenibacillus sp. GCM10027626]|uniref:DUF3626 domain-containing protein n=1 Tax=Paenibacillus sp. GCM10027626 TaxID=3273411 RepID=UPI0036414359
MEENCKLTAAQQAAIAFVRDYARQRKERAKELIAEIIRMSNIGLAAYEDAVASIKNYARIGLHFHPDRLDPDHKCVAEAMLEQGVYKSQFETLLSSGSVSAYPGGQRDLWEKGLFGGAYQRPEVTNRERPKYGALQLMLHPDGPAPRFGSCYFLLAPRVSRRSTFTYMDSHQNPVEKGTYSELDDIMAALLEEIFLRDSALGQQRLYPPSFIEHLRYRLREPIADPVHDTPARNLNHYIEAQVHGDIRLQDDVEVLVADPSFRGTPMEETFKRLCAKYAIELYWHRGFRLAVDQVPADFRGATMPSLAKRIAQEGYIDARLIGEAAQALKQNPAQWSDRGTEAEVLQELKLLWHVLVRYG